MVRIGPDGVDRTCMDSVEVLGFAWLVLLMPPVHRALKGHFTTEFTVCLVAAHQTQRLQRVDRAEGGGTVRMGSARRLCSTIRRRSTNRAHPPMAGPGCGN